MSESELSRKEASLLALGMVIVSGAIFLVGYLSADRLVQFLAG